MADVNGARGASPEGGASLVFDTLERQPRHAERVTRWWYDEWGHESAELTFEALLERTRRELRGVLPVTVLAFDGADPGGPPLGVAELKAHELLHRYPERTPWLGGVYVDAPHRGRGIAGALVREVERIAREAGFRRLHLNTEAPDGGLYARLGWQPGERIEAHGLATLLMTRTLEP